jgi:hypothetical protein
MLKLEFCEDYVSESRGVILAVVFMAGGRTDTLGEEFTGIATGNGQSLVK